MGFLAALTRHRNDKPVNSLAPDFLVLAPQQFSEFLHLTSAAICAEASAVFVPAFEMAKTNPTRVTAINADVDRARFVAVDVNSSRSSIC